MIGPEHLLLSDNMSAREQILDSALSQLIGGTEGMPTILAHLRRRLIALALERTHGDHAAAARLLGVDTIDLGG